MREEDLARALGELVKQVRIPTELADRVASVLRESQSEKEQFVRQATMRLQQQQLLLRSKLDRAYDDRLSGQVSEELWKRKSVELEAELQIVAGADLLARSALARAGPGDPVHVVPGAPPRCDTAPTASPSTSTTVHPVGRSVSV